MIANWTSLARLAPYLRAHRRTILLGLLAQVLANLASMASPMIVKAGFDTLAEAVVDLGRIRSLALLLLGVALFEGLCRFWMRRLLIGLSRTVEYDLRNDLFRHLQRLSPALYQRVRIGDLMSRATNDLNAVRMVLGPGFMYFSNTLMTVVMGLVMMATLHPLLVLWAALPMMVLTFLVRRVGRHIHDRAMAVQRATADLSTAGQEALAGIRVVKTYGLQRQQIDTFRDRSLEAVHRTIRLVLLQAALWPSLGLLAAASVIGALYLGSHMVMAGMMSVGSLVAFLQYLGLLTWPMIALGWVLNMVERGRASMDRIQQLFEIAPDPPPRPETAAAAADLRRLAAPDPPGIALRGVTCCYPTETIPGFETVPLGAVRRSVQVGATRPRRCALEAVDAEIRRGTTVGVVGPTGAGKTTLANLLVRYIDPREGRVEINGVDLRRLPLADLRRRIGLVPQEPFLFSDTVEGNIRFGRPEASRAEIEEVARIAALDADIAQLPEGLDTVVGERGVTLSGGQKARVALARTLLTRPSLLILDDCLRNLDAATEARVLQQIGASIRALTTVLISHRISTMELADWILVFDEGRLVDQGRHADLLDREGIYRTLYRHQILEGEIAAQEVPE